MTEKRKLLYCEGSSKKDFKGFPVPVQKDMGVSLFVVQLGGTPDIATPQPDVELIEKRLKAVLARYAANRRI
ncbi:hypothetical protein [Castellaniella sp.]|uniref:hypothetical protein n=1 Tax=Castellaniella sp. TaxID=1955812 RepID=UPI00355ED3ED